MISKALIKYLLHARHFCTHTVSLTLLNTGRGSATGTKGLGHRWTETLPRLPSQAGKTEAAAGQLGPTCCQGTATVSVFRGCFTSANLGEKVVALCGHSPRQILKGASRARETSEYH